MDEVIRVEKVSKSFGPTQVLSETTFWVRKQEIVGLVGRNGSGKTVLMKLICGLLSPTEGTVTVNGKQVGSESEIPEGIGILIERPGLFDQFSARKNLLFFQSLSGRRDESVVDEVIRKVGLDPTEKKPVGKYSMGMRQRMGIAQAILDDPMILILDEPTSGLDNNGVEQIRRMLFEMRDSGKTILLSSHYKEDIEQLCDHILELDHGMVIREWKKEEEDDEM